MKLDPEETWFIGDTFEIDVVGAKNSGLHVIWFNHRNRPMPEGDIVPDVEVTSGQELFEYIKNYNSTPSNIHTYGGLNSCPCMRKTK